MSENSELNDEKVIEAWNENADPWTRAVRGRTIESRNLVTDNAIIEAVTSRHPRTVLDLGCGEGWLTRALGARGIDCIGVDAIASLVDRAIALGGGDFRVASYEEIAEHGLDVRVDAVVANFSLIGGPAVDAVIRRIPSLLQTSGSFIVQTLHPHVASDGIPYRDGWHEGSWAGCGSTFSSRAAPWYFRTIGTWIRTLRDSGLRLSELKEPLDPSSGRPASIILISVI